MEYARSHIAAMALGLLLTVVGHDALMAADPHRSPNAGHVGQHESPAPAQENDCGLATGSHPTTSNELDVDDPTMVQALPQGEERLTDFRPHWSVEPDHPPDIRRALLQVYLN